MDDGTCNGGVILQTNAFSVSEVQLLSDVLFEKFLIVSYLRYERNQPVIYIPASQLNLVRSLVLQHMVPSTFYKLNCD